MIAIKAHKSKESKVAPLSSRAREMEEFSFVHSSSRARGIAEGREELLGLLRDLPESDYELSLTDIVEKGSVDDARSSVSKEKATASTSHGGEPIDPKTRAATAKEKKKKIMVSSSSFRSASDGVLLNVYLPAALTRSLTAPRMSRGAVHKTTTECNKR